MGRNDGDGLLIAETVLLGDCDQKLRSDFHLRKREALALSRGYCRLLELTVARDADQGTFLGGEFILPLVVGMEGWDFKAHQLGYLGVKVEVSLAKIMEHVVCVGDATRPPICHEGALREEELARDQGVGRSCKSGFTGTSHGGHEVGPNIVEEAPCESVVVMGTRDGGGTNATQCTYRDIAELCDDGTAHPN